MKKLTKYKSTNEPAFIKNFLLILYQDVKYSNVSKNYKINLKTNGFETNEYRVRIASFYLSSANIKSVA